MQNCTASTYTINVEHSNLFHITKYKARNEAWRFMDLFVQEKMR